MAESPMVVVYLDEGPSGICGQSMSITCDHTHVLIFDSLVEADDYIKQHPLPRGRRKADYRLVGGDFLGSQFKDFRKGGSNNGITE